MDGLLEQGKTKWTQNNEGQLGKPDERGAFLGMLCWYLAKSGKAIVLLEKEIVQLSSRGRLKVARRGIQKSLTGDSTVWETYQGKNAWFKDGKKGI